MPGYRKGSFTASAESLTIDNATEVDVALSGTFSASVVLQTAMADANGADAWVPVGAAMTAPGLYSFSSRTTRKWRLTNVWASGQADYELVGMRNTHLLAST